MHRYLILLTRNRVGNLKYDLSKLELKATSSHFSNPSVDVCKELATNFFIHNALKILSKLSISESIAFSCVCRVLGLLLADMIDTLEVFFNTKGGSAKAYLRKIKACERG